jgi:Flp pilus assembly protein TadD
MEIPTPEKELYISLQDMAALGPARLAQMLCGDLPALGSDYRPAEYIWEALRVDDGRREQEMGLARLCAQLLQAVGPNEDPDYLFNLFLLGQMLQEPGILFEPALDLERRNVSGQISLKPKLRRELRRLVIFNQAGQSLRLRWLALLRQPGQEPNYDDLLDAFVGLMWLPSTDASAIPVDAIREGLGLLGEAVGERIRGEEYLRAALRGLRHAYPNDQWARWLSADFQNWGVMLQELAIQEIPGLGSLVRPGAEQETQEASYDDLISAGITEALGGLEEPPALREWLRDRGITPSIRSRLVTRDFQGMESDIVFLDTVMRDWPLAKSLLPAVFLARWVHAIQRLAGYERPALPLKPLSDTHEEAEQYAVRPQTVTRSPFEAYQWVLGQVEATVERIRLGDERTARQWARQLVEAQKQSGTDSSLIAKSLSNLATRARNLGRLSLAVDWAREGCEMAPEDPVAHAGLAETLKVAGRLEEAERLYRDTLDRFPEDVVVRSGLAETLKVAGRLEEAEGLYRETLDRFPENVVVRNGLAETLKVAGRLEEAEGLYRETVGRFPEDVVGRNGLTETLKVAGRLEEAERLYRETLEGFPEDVVARSGLAGTLKVAGRLEEAEGLYRETLDRFPEDVVVRSGLAETLKVAGRLEEAERLYRETLERFPGNAVVQSGLASLLAARGRFDEAMEMLPYREQPRIPAEWIAHHQRAMITLRSAHEGETRAEDLETEAVQMLEFGLLHCPFPLHRHYYRSALAFYALRRGDYERAERLLTDPAPGSEPVFEVARLHLAGARRQLDVSRPKLRLLLQYPALSETVHLIDRRFGIEGPPAPHPEVEELDWRIFVQELNSLPLAASYSFA